MIAVGKGERGRNRSEYPVRKQGHGHLLAEWLNIFVLFLYLESELKYASTISQTLTIFVTIYGFLVNFLLTFLQSVPLLTRQQFF